MSLATIAGQAGLARAVEPAATETVRGGALVPGAERTVGGPGFQGVLDQALRGGGSTTGAATGAVRLGGLGALGPMGAGVESSGLKFSAHAIDRMRSRGISFAPEMMKSIEGAVQKAALKGSKDTLILTGDSALIVAVKNNTVVTVMDKSSMRENVFTNIDSTVVL